MRGGYGRYYDFPYTNATLLFPATAVQSNYGVVYNVRNPDGIRNADGSFFRPGQTLPPNGIAGAEVPPPNEVASPTQATPYSDQLSLGLSWQATDWLGLNFEAVSIQYRDIPFRFRANPIDPATGARRFPDFGNFRLWYGKGEADYQGANLSFRARATSKLELQGFYTYSKAEGNVLAGADEFRLTNVAHQPGLRIGRDVSFNTLDPLCGACTGPLNTDARHRFTLSAVYQGPWGINASGMYRYRSALPYTVYTTNDLNNDGFGFDLLPGGKVNSARGDSFSQLDLRLSKQLQLRPRRPRADRRDVQRLQRGEPGRPHADLRRRRQSDRRRADVLLGRPAPGRAAPDPGRRPGQLLTAPRIPRKEGALRRPLFFLELERYLHAAAPFISSEPRSVGQVCVHVFDVYYSRRRRAMKMSRWAVRPVALLALLALALGFALAPAAQAQTSAGNLVGKVQDKEGTALPGVTVTATQKDTGVTRSTVSESDGTFRLPSLPIGLYTVTVELDGFATVTIDEVRMSVASQREINVDMSASTVEESITVVDEAPLVQTTPSIGTVVSEQQLENLPLNGRQFANLAVLAPGTALSYNSDPTKPGQLTVALNGGIGRNVNYLIDGGDNTDDTIGGALQNFNLESVAEFNIQTQQYKAEYGRSTGGVLTVVTKTGTNNLAGSAWGFFRDDSLNSKTESENLAGIDKQPYERKQYGLALGGPFVKDRAHYFATYEKTERETSYTVDTDPDGPGRPGQPTFPAFQGTSVAIPFEDELLTAKGTVNISPKQYLQVRYGFQKNTDKYGASALATPDSLGTVTNKYQSILAGHSFQIGTDSLNEFVFQYTTFENAITADSTAPYLYFPSGAHTGQNINTPQTTEQTKYQFKDDFSFSRTLGGRANNFKVGVNYIHEPTLRASATTGTTGQYSFATNDPSSPVVDITFFGGFSGLSTPVDQYSVYAQDDLLVSDRLTINVGLRYDYWDGYDLNQSTNPIQQALSSQTRYNEYYLQDFKNGGAAQLENDDDNFGPRLGFTWDLKGDGRNLVRGGYGRYYDFPYTNATILFPSGAVQSSFGVVYNVHNNAGIRNADGTLFRPGQPLPANQLPGAAINPPNEVASPTLATPYSEQISLGYSWQATDWLGLNFEVSSIDYRDIPFRFRANPFDPATGRRRFPEFGNFRIWYGNGKADYDGANISFRARATSKLELQGFYTYSKVEGNVLAGADEFRLTNVAYQPGLRIGRDVSFNTFDPLCGACSGPLNTDAKHRFTLSAVYQGPWGINASGMYRFRSATPYTVYTTNDLNRDGNRLDLLPGGSVNTERGDSFSQLDVRLSKEFKFGPVGLELIAEVFNVFNEENPAGFTLLFDAAGNPIGAEPSFYSGDPLQGEQRLAQVGLRVRF